MVDGRWVPAVIMEGVIRDFDVSDQSAFRELVLSGLAERWGESFDASFNRDLDDIAGTYVAHGADVVVVENGDQVVAGGILRSVDGDRGRIVRMSVDRRCRRQGLGRHVVDELLRRARGRGFREVVVSTDTPWMSAVALYRACGSWRSTGKRLTRTSPSNYEASRRCSGVGTFERTVDGGPADVE